MDKMEYQRCLMSNIYCGNCGKSGHLYRQCRDYICSYGLLCFRLNDRRDNVDDFITLKTSPRLLRSRYEIILVQRRKTIGYVEFMRGKYHIEEEYEDYLKQLMEIMTNNERENIKLVGDFDKLRDELKLNMHMYNYRIEYDNAKYKFNELKRSGRLDRLIDSCENKWLMTEWGIPKGRRNHRESDLSCAIREFIEETSMPPEYLTVYKNIEPLEEIYQGTNGINYKHIYYIGYVSGPDELLDNLEINPENQDQINEIENIGWFSANDAMNIIRPYYANKITCIRRAFNIIEDLQV